MPGRRNRKVFSQALDDAEEDCLDYVQCHVSSATGRDGLGRMIATSFPVFSGAPSSERSPHLGRGLKAVLTKSKPASRVFLRARFRAKPAACFCDHAVTPTFGQGS